MRPTRTLFVAFAVLLLALLSAPGCNIGDDGVDTTPDDDRSTDDTGRIADTGSDNVGPTRTVVRAEDFDQSCSSDDDCVPVLEGDVCSCSCDVAAVNGEMLTSFRKARKRAADNCDQAPECESCGEPPTVVCSSHGKCIVRENATADAGGGTDAGDSSGADAM